MADPATDEANAVLRAAWPSGELSWASAVTFGIGCVLALLLLLALRIAWAGCVCSRLRWKAQWCVRQDEEESTQQFLPPGEVESSSQAKEADSSSQPLPAPRSHHWDLRERKVLVTGGSKGLGRAIVEEMLLQGCEVLTCSRDIGPLAELLKREARCVAISADVSTAEGRARVLEIVHKKFSGKLDILVNNVGTNIRKHSSEYKDSEYDFLTATNQSSAFHLSRACFGALRRRKGCVINISSISGSTVDNTGAPYAMNKAALEQLTRYLACEWGPLGIRVNAVAPWFVRTPLTSPLLADPRFFDAVRRVTPMARVGEPHEVACVVAFLAMPAAGYISGQVVGVDGAMMQEGFRYMG